MSVLTLMVVGYLAALAVSSHTPATDSAQQARPPQLAAIPADVPRGQRLAPAAYREPIFVGDAAGAPVSSSSFSGSGSSVSNGGSMSINGSYSHDGLSGSGSDSSDAFPNTTVAPPVPQRRWPKHYPGILTAYPFFFPMMPVVFDSCSDSFFDTCQPALEANLTGLLSSYRSNTLLCYYTFCHCLPDGAFDTQSRCHYTEFHNWNDFCHMVEDCLPTRDTCVLRFVYDELPSQCDAFLKCSKETSVLQSSEEQCESDVSSLYQDRCDGKASCSYLWKAAGVPDPYYEGDSQAMRRLSTSFAIGIYMTASCIAILLMLLVVLLVRWRRVRQLDREVDEVMIDVVEPVEYYGASQLAVSIPMAGPRDDNHSTPADGVGARRRCSVCKAPGTDPWRRRVMLLPCRDEWCGCGGPADAVPRRRSRAPSRTSPGDPASSDSVPSAATKLQYPADVVADYVEAVAETVKTRRGASSGGNAKLCVGCNQDVKCAVDLTAVHNAGAPQQLGSHDDLDDPSVALPRCVVCLDKPAEVVLLPCTHITTCSDCSAPLQDAVPRRNEDRSRILVSCQCPICRERITHMVLLEAEQLLACSAAAVRAATADALAARRAARGPAVALPVTVTPEARRDAPTQAPVIPVAAEEPVVLSGVVCEEPMLGAAQAPEVIARSPAREPSNDAPTPDRSDEDDSAQERAVATVPPSL